MAREFEVFLDSGANIHSRYSTNVSLDELGIESDEWDAMSDNEKDEVMRDIAFDHSEWGYFEIGKEKESNG